MTSVPTGSTAISSSGSSQISNVLSPTSSRRRFRTCSQSSRSARPGIPRPRRTSSRSIRTDRRRLRPRAVTYVSSTTIESGGLPPSGGLGGCFLVLGFWGSFPARALAAGVSAGVLPGFVPGFRAARARKVSDPDRPLCPKPRSGQDTSRAELSDRDRPLARKPRSGSDTFPAVSVRS